ncbi:MAG: hypothetical protein GEU73_05195 [Chloroflexi bacterium]|nr:hypothetical protein [Chloroflexota bacterium]
MTEPTADGNRVAAYLKVQIAELSGELAVTKALLDAKTEEHAKVLRALEADENAKEGKPGLKVAGEDK